MLRFDINFVFTIINLLILYFLLRKFLFGRVRDVMDKRAQEVENSFEDARKAREEADAVKAKYEAAAGAAKEESEQEAARIRSEADQEREKILVKAREEAEKIVLEAGQKADRLREDKLRSAGDELADLVAEAADKLDAAEGKYSTEDNRRLFDAFLDQAVQKDQGRSPSQTGNAE